MEDLGPTFVHSFNNCSVTFRGGPGIVTQVRVMSHQSNIETNNRWKNDFSYILSASNLQFQTSEKKIKLNVQITVFPD